MAEDKPRRGDMNRKAWKAQRTLSEIRDWHRWVNDSLETFADELKDLSKAPKMPAEDVANMSLVQERLGEIRQSLKPLEKTLAQATGQRIKRSRKKRP